MKRLLIPQLVVLLFCLPAYTVEQKSACADSLDSYLKKTYENLHRNYVMMKMRIVDQQKTAKELVPIHQQARIIKRNYAAPGIALSTDASLVAYAMLVAPVAAPAVVVTSIGVGAYVVIANSLDDKKSDETTAARIQQYKFKKTSKAELPKNIKSISTRDYTARVDGLFADVSSKISELETGLVKMTNDNTNKLPHWYENDKYVNELYIEARSKEEIYKSAVTEYNKLLLDMNSFCTAIKTADADAVKQKSKSTHAPSSDNLNTDENQ